MRSRRLGVPEREGVTFEHEDEHEHAYVHGYTGDGRRGRETRTMEVSLPWVSPRRPVVRLVRIETRVLDALADGELSNAALAAGTSFVLDPWLVEARPRRTLGYRSTQVAITPEHGDWVTRFVVDDALAQVVGLAGFHGPPDEEGRVEVGYQIADGYQRRGYGRAAFEALLDVAGRAASVTIVRASIAPTNEASLALVAPYGFAQIGEQWDDEDGLELLFERASR